MTRIDWGTVAAWTGGIALSACTWVGVYALMSLVVLR